MSSECIIGIEGNGSEEFGFCSRPIQVVPGVKTCQNVVGCGLTIVDFESLQRGCFALCPRLLRSDHRVGASGQIRICQTRVRLRESGINFNGPLKSVNRLLPAATRVLEEVEPALQVESVSLRVDGVGLLERSHNGVDLLGDFSGDSSLQIENVRRVLV